MTSRYYCLFWRNYLASCEFISSVSLQAGSSYFPCTMGIFSRETNVCVGAGCPHFVLTVNRPPLPVLLQGLHFLSILTGLLGVCDLPSLGDLDCWRSGDSQSAWVPRSSELQRETSGERRCFRSFDRPRSLPPERWVSDLWPGRKDKST